VDAEFRVITGGLDEAESFLRFEIPVRRGSLQNLL
jgi:hypothetical protein